MNEKTVTNVLSSLEDQQACEEIKTFKDFGEFLKKERESRFITFQDISKVTRIRVYLLEALEKGDIDRLPSYHFIRGFIKSIAKFMGLDIEEVMLQFDKVSEKTFPEKFTNTRSEKEIKDTFPWFYVLMSSVCVVIITGIFFFLSYDYQEEKEEVKTQTVLLLPKEKIKKTMDLKSNLSPQKIKLPRNKARGIKFALNATPSTFKKEKNKSESVVDIPKIETFEQKKIDFSLKLTIKANQVCWVYLDIDEKKSYDLILKEGEKKSWEGNKEFKLTLGNAGGVEVYLNGKKIGPYGKSGQVAKKISISGKDL